MELSGSEPTTSGNWSTDQEKVTENQIRIHGQVSEKGLKDQGTRKCMLTGQKLIFSKKKTDLLEEED